MKQKVLIIGLVWPEPTSSAAGWRMLQLIDYFLTNDYDVHFACAAQPSDATYDLESIHVVQHPIKLNDTSFNLFIEKLQPEIVVFDRFMIEEQYGWRVREVCADTITILDTEDLHFVRKAREHSYRKQKLLNYYTEEAKRELAAILRCDLTLIISQAEKELLIDTFHIPSSSLLYVPFLQDTISKEIQESWSSFSERNHIMFIGNFWHEPNYQTVRYLKEIVWPQLREELPKAELHIYGAYATQKCLELHQPKERFHIKGKAEDVFKTMQDYRLLIAPIVFGAGLKGKFIDAMKSGLPSITNSIGAEGMVFNEKWSGFIEDDLEAFVKQTSLLFSDEKIWKEKQDLGKEIINDNFDKKKFYDSLSLTVSIIKSDILLWRKKHFLGQIIQQQQLLASKYLSKWIEEKNR